MPSEMFQRLKKTMDIKYYYETDSLFIYAVSNRLRD
jgi:hypothetical protein